MTGNVDGRHLVVVGVDGSAESVAALRWAGQYARATGAALRAVLAWHYPTAVGAAPVGVAPAPVREETEQQMQSTLDEAIAQAFPGSDAPAVEARLGYGHPAQVLIDESKDADLLAVGSRGRSSSAGMLLGSVSIHCVTNAACPGTVFRGG